MPKPTSKARPPEAKIALYEKLIASVPGVERKGDTIPYTSLNGWMVSSLNKAGRLCLRAPPELRDELIARHKARLAENYGIVQKDFVEIPDALLEKTAVVRKFFLRSIEHVKTLKPKPTTR